jgi:hypothetical protein
MAGNGMASDRDVLSSAGILLLWFSAAVRIRKYMV